MKTSVSIGQGVARWVLALAVAACLPFAAHADDYADVSKLVGARQYKEALAKADQYLSSKPRDPQMRFIRGVILSESGRNSEAISVFTKITEDFPELPEPYNNLAVLHAAQNQFDKARAALEMAIRTNPSYATAHENLGDVYARLASQAYSKALQLDASNTAVQPKLALIRTLFNPDPKGQRQPVAAAPAQTPAAPAAVLPKPSPAQAPAPAPVMAAAATSAVNAAATATTPAAPGTATAATAAVPAATTTTTTTTATAANAATATSAKSAQADVDAAVRRWAAAWESKDMDAYLKAYAKDFNVPGKLSRSAWEEDRRNKIVGKNKISVQLRDVVVTVNGNKATARFRQAYSADSLNINSRKTLELVQSDNRWLIVRESTGN